MSLTVTIPGAVEATVGSTAPATLVLELGVPGPTGATGATGAGVAAGGTTGQVLAKIDGTNYNTEWVNVGGDYLPLAGGTMTGAIVFDGTSGQYISKGNFDTSRGGNYGISLVCSIGYEFNWQAGWLTTTNQGSTTPRPLYLDSLAGTTLRAWNSATDEGTEVTHNSIVINSDPNYDSELAGWGLGVELSADNTQGTTVEYNGLHVYNGTDTINVNPTGINLTNSDTTKHTNITTSYINVTDDNNGYNVQLADGTITLTNGGTDSVLSINSNTGITFDDNTVQNTAFLGYDSPAFTGNPTAPTPATSDNDTTIATTAFVQSAIVAGSAHAETLVATVRNNTGSTLAAFTVVYISGAVGNKAAVAKAQANSESTSSGTFAVTETAIANNANGNVVSAGVLSGVDTSAFTDGDKLYLSPTVAGGVTTTKPSAPNHLVYVGVVTRSHSSLGTVSVRIQNGYELEELHNVAIASVADKDSLFYESSTSLWKNYTPANARTNLGLGTASTLASSAVAQTANNLSDLASASTARTNLGLGTMATQSSATYATVASPSLTGTPLSTTASVSTNTTQIATTAFVLGQVGTATPIVNGTAAVGTSLLYAREDHVHGTDTTRAALASPTFSGTPSLPTGTTGITQTAGNNTTALATTAFVTAAVPALATNAQTVAGTSMATAITPAANYWADKRSGHSFVQFNSMAGTTSGTGASGGLSLGGYYVYSPTTAIGYAIGSFAFASAQRGIDRYSGSWNWSKAFTATFRYTRNAAPTDANTVSRVTFGKAAVSAGNPTIQSVGIRLVGSGAIELIVHNGTTLTAVTSTSSFVPTVPLGCDIRIVSNGAGTVQLYINDTLEATTTAGPTSASGTTLANLFMIEAQNVAIITGSQAFHTVYNLHIEFAD